MKKQLQKFYVRNSRTTPIQLLRSLINGKMGPKWNAWEEANIEACVKGFWSYPLIDHADNYLVPGQGGKSTRVMVAYAYSGFTSQDQLQELRQMLDNRGLQGLLRAVRVLSRESEIGYKLIPNTSSQMIKVMLAEQTLSDEVWEKVEEYPFRDVYDKYKLPKQERYDMWDHTQYVAQTAGQN